MFEKFKSRSHELERLDKGEYTPAEYQIWQREMEWVHRFFGEQRALRATLLRDIARDGGNEVSVLDAGAGSGELLSVLAGWLPGQTKCFAGLEIEMDAARSIAAKGLISVRGNALDMPFCDGAFDYAFCSLVLHHLDDEAAVALLREMRRVARRRLYVIDLNRHPTAYYIYKTLGPLFFQRFTIEDGALSILRSFTESELKVLAEKAGLRDVKVQHSRVNRLILSGI